MTYSSFPLSVLGDKTQGFPAHNAGQSLTAWRACTAQLLSHIRLFCDPMDCSPPGSSAQGISQARILEWVAISFSRGSSWPRDGTCVSCISSWVLHLWATSKEQCSVFFLLFIECILCLSKLSTARSWRLYWRATLCCVDEFGVVSTVDNLGFFPWHLLLPLGVLCAMTKWCHY